MSKTWFITGANRGFGLEFAKAALERGDRVAATSRKLSGLDVLVSEYGDNVLPLALEITDRDAVFATVQKAVDHFGRLDVVINNAGYGVFGAVEEVSIEQVRDQMEVNFFGLLHVTQAVIPVLREQSSGHIIQISTIGGVVAFPNLGAYHASKWAVEGITESLSQEVGSFGIKVTLVEPGGYSTDWAGSSAVHARQLPQYDALRDGMRANQGAASMGDPSAVGPAILAVVDADDAPLRVFFGTPPLQLAPAAYKARLDTCKAWEAVSIAAQG